MLERLFAFGIDPVDGVCHTRSPPIGPLIAGPTLLPKRPVSALMKSRGLDERDHADIWRSVMRCDGSSSIFMHIETLSHMLPHLPQSAFVPAAIVLSIPNQDLPNQAMTASGPPTLSGGSRDPGWTDLRSVGSEQTFGWDNEFGVG